MTYREHHHAICENCHDDLPHGTFAAFYYGNELLCQACVEGKLRDAEHELDHAHGFIAKGFARQRVEELKKLLQGG